MDESINAIVTKLKDKDDKAACEYARKLGAESSVSDKYLSMIPEFAAMLDDKNSYVRTRGFGLICNQARWAKEGQIDAVFGQMIPLLNDPKPTVVRQCLGALHEVVSFRPEMETKIERAVAAIDTTKYKDSMSSLIKRDMEALKNTINQQEKGK